MVVAPSYVSAGYLEGLLLLLVGVILPIFYMVYKNRKMFQKQT